MQSVPSLVGAGTAVAAAATGVVFGQLVDGQLPPPSPVPGKRKSTHEQDFASATLSSRPVTRSSTTPFPAADEFGQPSPLNNTTSRPQYPRRSSQTQTTPPKSGTWRNSLVKPGEFVPGIPIVEDARDSFSSNGSWMRRLSIRPRSQHGSLRSSVGPDSPSLFSFGSGAPILSPSGNSPPQLPPNKLVKRASTNGRTEPGFLTRRGSKAQMTLRRPATSHQRSATLQQQITIDALPPLPKFSLEQHSRSRAQTVDNPVAELDSHTYKAESPLWKSFWHSRVSRTAVKMSALRNSDGGASTSAKRICVEPQSRQRVYLVEPSAVTNNALQVSEDTARELQIPSSFEGSPETPEKSTVSQEDTPSKQPRRSISMHFSSPTNWISKTGSVRRRKRGDTTGGNKRHVSDPISAVTEPKPSRNKATQEKIYDAPVVSHAESELAAIFRPPETERPLPSPLPPLSRLSSLHLDFNRSSSSSSPTPRRTDEMEVNLVNQRVGSNTSHTRTFERASTVGSSEYHRGFTSGDDDDTDFKTDTPFDSFRTVGSGRRRTLDSPLESMFDESPPGTASNSTKHKRLSIQEILGSAFHEGDRIMEEDESISTPVRGTYDKGNVDRHALGYENGNHTSALPSSPDITLDKDYGRLSIDDDDDDLDWAKNDDPEVFHHLSPPSSMNSRRGSPNLRTAPVKVNISGRSDELSDIGSERPRSTVFDWTEPPTHEKHDGDGYSYRPKTVHGKQELDVRGGRSVNRKGPSAAHIRSQSVPVVPDPTETAKSTPKFGTWGLGQKNVSEDWEDDFDFEEGDVGGVSNKGAKQFSMLVPAAIQATQPTVKAHSGQIRELSLLVNDLKRLCRLGREMNMLNGPSTKLWREAEGIIALASPDEDDVENAGAFQTSGDSTTDPVGGRFVDQGYDVSALNDPEISKKIGASRSGAVRDRPAGRRRSVFSPEDDIFGTWDHTKEKDVPARPRTPETLLANSEYGSTIVARSMMEAMRQRYARSKAEDDEDDERSNGKLDFDTNSLKDLVKRASDLRDSLSDLVRQADHITQSPVRTPKHTRPDGSPAFTRVFDEPTASPTRRIPQSQTNNSMLSSSSVSASPNGLGQRLQMMTVS